ncbi:hypothetical protein K435DRAFT_740455 [Dendrothele bispora CBS 962.96]|uniref:Protein EFR3 n=1 Tax=Dendrothele bispora (strain CBS 962.96) TaxID=1314807 RepID=A0A4S8N0K5_DENBC|nr:hypothetical protein K435DRAFT_740455 [Dendrothele bispora CBS 962.96]
MNFFTPNHVQHLNSCYPPTSILLASGSDYTPNSQELSRLTYYASNHPEKLSKLGSELEKRVKTECRKFRSGNVRNRATLLLELSIFRSLAIECRRDIALLSPSLLASIEVTLSITSNDLEVVSRAASVFTAWTTYTDGHLIGADSSLTKDYLSILRHFAALSSSEAKDSEVRNRTRLIGFAALTGAVNSEALFNDSVQFRTQVSIFLRPVLLTVLQTDLKVLEKQAEGVKDAPISPYLAEFRTRPVMERRAASIHIHIDGDKGPSMSDVSSAALRALFSLLEHVNGSQLSSILRSWLDNLGELKGWSKVSHCCWFAQKITEWSQYQYRYAVPNILVEHLVAQGQDGQQTTDLSQTLITMVTTVFSSPVPLVNLSTSDILSNLVMILLRRCSTNHEDPLLPSLIQCISSLGRHVYYSDQIHDLAAELINRLSTLEVQGIVARSSPSFSASRSQVIRCLISGLVGLINEADKNEPNEPRSLSPVAGSAASVEAATQDAGLNERHSRRTRVPTDLWQDTLSLICDADYAVRAECAQALDFYIDREMPKQGDFTNVDGTKRQIPALNVNMMLRGGDHGVKFLHSVHACLYTLATSSTLGLGPSTPTSENGPILTVQPATPLAENHPDTSQIHERRSSHPSKSRKMSMVFRLMEQAPEQVQPTASATLSDYSLIFKILQRIQEELPVRGMVTGVPMLLALDNACQPPERVTSEMMVRINVIKLILARTWLAIGKTWGSAELVEIAEKALSSKPPSVMLSEIQSTELGTYYPPTEPEPLPSTASEPVWPGIDAQAALLAIVSNKNIQEATSMNRQTLLERLSITWTACSALKESVERPSMYDATLRGDGVSPLLKISPGLMNIENLSLQSLARSNRGVGVTELREALEGRSSMSQTALNKAASISTLDHVSSILGSDNRLTPTRSRNRGKKRAVPSGSGEVRDVLNKLGLGKQNGSLLKASFPALQSEKSAVAGTR